MVGELQAGDPQSLGPYRLLGRLGAGGMGQVFLGRSGGGRLVAVKVIRPELAGEPGFRARFAREVTAARNVSGLFTALVVDADIEGPLPWLATAYVAGPSLAEAVEAHGPLPVGSVLTLAAGLAEGLEAIHAAGVVHRDLKPSNVLLAYDGPRVIDFGISRAMEASVLTQSGTVMGSPGFMSPEQAEGLAVGPSSDVFSLGAVLTFAATGVGPFGTGSTPALIYRVVHRQPDISALPEPVRSVVGRCLAKDPSQRPGTSGLLAELGTAQLAHDWLPAPLAEDLGQYAATMTSAKQRRTPTAAAFQAQPGETEGQPQRRSQRRLTWALIAGGLLAACAAAAIVVPGAVRGAVATPAHTAVQTGTTISPSATSGPSLTGGSVPSTQPDTRPSAKTSSGSTGPGPSPKHTTPAATTPPATPGGVTATAAGQYAIGVNWTDTSPGVSGFHIDNGCPVGACQPGATLTQTTGPVRATRFAVTPGTYQCFRVQAFDSAGTSGWSGYGCTSTPGLTVPGTQEWTDTGVTVAAGDRLGITAAGQVYAATPGSAEGPSGNQSCTPAADYSSQSSQFPAPTLPCWSLVARIGNGPPFEVSTSDLTTATAGRLYLGINDDAFSGNSGNWTANIKIGGLPPPP